MKLPATTALALLLKYLSNPYLLSPEEMSVINALYSGSAKLEFDLERCRPPSDQNSLTLLDAYRHHVRGYPRLVRLLGEPQTASPAPSRIRIPNHARPPIWRPPRAARRRGRSRKRWLESEPEIERFGSRVRVTPYDGLTPLDRRGSLRKSMHQYLYDAAVYSLVERLASGELQAEGVGESSLMTLRRVATPADWWRRDIELDLSANAILEVVRLGTQTRIRRYSDVRVGRIGSSTKRRGTGRPTYAEDFPAAISDLWEDGSLTLADLGSTKGLHDKVLKRLGLNERMKGCSYSTFAKHAKPEIDRLLRDSNSEN